MLPHVSAGRFAKIGVSRPGGAGRSAKATPIARVKLYSAMLSRREDTVEVCVALAKLYEHQLGDSRQALLYTRQALLILAEPGLALDEAVQSQRNALQYRYARLRRKIAGGSGQ